jgi:hypothetical protein
MARVILSTCLRHGSVTTPAVGASDGLLYAQPTLERVGTRTVLRTTSLGAR